MALVDERWPQTDRRPAPTYDRQPPQDEAAEMSVLGGMLMSKDAIADVVETVRATDFYKPAHTLIYESDRRPVFARRTGRPDHRRGGIGPGEHACTGPAAVPTCTAWWPPCPPPPMPPSTRRSSRRRRSCGDWWTPAPGSSNSVTAAARARWGRRGRRDRRPGPGRDLRGHRATHHRGLRGAGGTAPADHGRDRRDRQPGRHVGRGTHRLRRPGQGDQRPAPGPDGDHRGETRRGEIDAGIRYCAACLGPSPHVVGDLLAWKCPAPRSPCGCCRRRPASS